MSERVSQNGVRQHVTEGGVLYAKTTFHDDAALDINTNIRNSKMLEKAKLGLHDGEDVRLVISCPDTLQWMYWKRDNPDIYAMLHSKDEAERMRAAKLIQIMQPSWVVQHRL